MSVSVTQGRLWQLVAFLQPLPAREKLAKQALIEYVKKCVLPVRGGVEQLLLLPHTLPVVDAAVVVVFSTFRAFEAERATKSRFLEPLCRRRRCRSVHVVAVVDEMSVAWADLESGQRFESRHCKV